MVVGVVERERRSKRDGERVEVGEALQQRYDELLGLVLRTGEWLSSGPLAGEDASLWEGAFAEYRQNLRALKRLGEQLRPGVLRDGEESLEGPALAGEAAELFAA
jgi:hypothetical protein